MKPLKTLSSKKVFEHPWETIEIEKVQLNNGKIIDYLISKPNPFVIVILTNSQKQLLILRQYKHGAKEYLFGFPAGYMNIGENALHAAKRELMEETGIVAKNWKKLGFYYENSTRSPVMFHVFSAVVGSYSSGGDNTDIVEGKIKALWITKKELQKDASNKFLSSPMLTAFAAYIFNKK